MHLSEIERRAWDNRTGADQHKPVMALKAALDDIETGKVDPRHVIVVMIEPCGQYDRVMYQQAGDLHEFAIEGALIRASRIAAETRD